MAADDIKSQIGEAMKKIMSNADKTKTEFLSTFARESAQVLSKIDIANEAKKFFETHKMKLVFEVSFEAKDGKEKKEKRSKSKSE